jgi:lysophospholipase L1-like esterase
MKYILCFIFCLCFLLSSFAQVTNQNLYDTIPTMPEHYRERLVQFRTEPVFTGRIIFLGNSITEGGDWKKLTGDTSIVNRGIGGDVTFGILNRLDDIIIRKPSKLFILIGINDIAKDFPIDVIVDNYIKIIRGIRSGSPQTKIYVQSLFPVNSAYRKFPQHYDKTDYVLKLNSRLRALCDLEKVGFVDLYPLLLKDGALNSACTYDGLHLNQQGYEKWVKFLKENHFL